MADDDDMRKQGYTGADDTGMQDDEVDDVGYSGGQDERSDETGQQEMDEE